MSEKGSTDFRYQLSGNYSVLVVHLFGEMNSKSAPQIGRCLEEISPQPHVKFVIFSFSNVTHINGDAVQALAQMQRDIRSKSALRICGMKPELKEKLTRLGVIRSLEMVDSLREGIDSISRVKPQSA